jgi:uncharacterized protein
MPRSGSLAHGGKGWHPYPVPTKILDETIVVLKSALAGAKLGNEERLDAIRRRVAPFREAKTKP